MTGTTRRRPLGEEGFVTVAVVGLLLVLLCLGGLTATLGSIAVLRHRAAAAADLAAMAAAKHALEGQAAACDAARLVAGRQGAVLRSCHLEGWDAVVSVQIAAGGRLAGLGRADGRARAGPVRSPVP
jgi:secretion/DNA translocation related TadE-like protein